MEDLNPGHELRRLIPRQRTDWKGVYMVLGDPECRWRECRIVDVSSAGAGLRLADSVPEETEGKEIVLAVQLKAQVRYTREEGEEALKVGTQFVDLSDSERDCLTALQGLEAGW